MFGHAAISIRIIAAVPLCCGKATEVPELVRKRTVYVVADVVAGESK
jgi:hypothetical protein